MMNSSQVPRSDCCNAIINQDECGDRCDKCSACKKDISYALIGAPNDFSAHGVCQLHSGDYYFFWHSVSKWTQVIERRAYGENYIGQVKQRWTIGMKYDQFPDRISYSRHLAFSNEWKDKVKNPEYALPPR